ncbi:MAG: ADOP family duplicated permease [Thermoanaerobaculia bacterium]|nr:ADOP family duplicated permease [Thermoanaerobaculia bacterium]
MMLHEVRLALASLRKESLLSVLVVLILAVSLGVHTAVFSLIHAAFFRPLPYEDAERLVVIESVSSKTGGSWGLSVPDADDYRAEVSLLEEVGAFSARRDNLIQPDGRVTSIPSALVTAGVLPATGVHPVLGRLFEAGDDRQGADSFKVVIAHGLWRSHFGSDSDVLGQTLRTSLGTFEVIGVLPPGFGFPEGARMWFPYQSWIDTQDSGDTREDQRRLRWPEGLGRLAPDSSIEQAQTELSGIAESLAERFPETNEDWRPRITPFRQYATSDLAPHLRSLFVMTWVFMALAAVNLAGLQLARGVARAATFSLQLALGADRVRLGRQLLLETLLLTAPGALAGLLLAQALLNMLPRLVPTSLPAWLDVRLGIEEVGFAASAAVLVALVAGLAPLVVGWRLDLRSLLAGRAASAARGGRLRRFLVIAQLAIATILVVAASLLARSFGALDRIDPGFTTEQVVTVEMSPQYPGSYLEQTDSLAALYRRLQASLRDVPGVRAAGGATHLPYLDLDRWPAKVLARGGDNEDELEHQAPILAVDVTPGYFESMGIPIVEGRDFAWADSRDNGLVIILSQRAAEQLFPNQPAVGKEARLENDSWAQVIGVVGDVRYDPREAGFGAELYYPITQYKAWRQRLTVALDGSPTALLPAVRAALEAAAPETGVVEIRTLDSILDETLWQARLLGHLAPLFAIVALLLAALGVYGLLAHDLVNRRQELGVRSALGAQRAALARLVFWWGARLLILGVAGGAAITLTVAPVLTASLFGVGARDPVSFFIAFLALFAAGVAACLAPAWRAMRVHPSDSLRET